jgi:sulfate permease
LSSLMISYLLINLFSNPNIYNVLVVLSTLIVGIGTLSLLKIVRQETRSVFDKGGGI